jgi:hypothetical protein
VARSRARSSAVAPPSPEPDRGRGGRTSARRDGREVREDRAQLGHRGRGRGAEGAGSGNPPTCTYLMIYRSVCFLYFEEANVYMCQMDVFGCGPPRLLRLHRDTEGGRRGALRRVLTRRALGHWQIGMPCEDQSGARLQAAGCSLLGPGDNAVELPPAPRPVRQRGPSPEERHPVYAEPSKIQLV